MAKGIDLSEYSDDEDAENITYDNDQKYFQELLFRAINSTGSLSVGDILTDYFKLLEYGSFYTDILKDNNTYIFIAKE